MLLRFITHVFEDYYMLMRLLCMMICWLRVL